MAKLTLNSDILAAALIGFEVQKSQIDTKIAEIRSLLDGGGTAPTAPSDSGKSRRKVSAAARRRMARAQKLRWKRIKQAGAAQAESAKPKRVLSASARKAISAAQKARWAAKKTAQKKVAKAAAKKRTTKAGSTPQQAASTSA